MPSGGQGGRIRTLPSDSMPLDNMPLDNTGPVAADSAYCRDIAGSRTQ